MDFGFHDPTAHTTFGDHHSLMDDHSNGLFDHSGGICLAPSGIFDSPDHSSLVAQPHVSSYDGLSCDFYGAAKACNDNIMPKMVGAAVAGGAVGAVGGGLAGAGAGALAGAVSGGTAGCVSGTYSHLAGCN